MSAKELRKAPTMPVTNLQRILHPPPRASSFVAIEEADKALKQLEEEEDEEEGREGNRDDTVYHRRAIPSLVSRSAVEYRS